MTPSRRRGWRLAAALLLFAGFGQALVQDLDEIRQAGVLRHLGIPYANFITGAGDGLDVELMQGFAAHLGVKYEYVPTDWGRVFGDLNGRNAKRAADGHAELLDEASIKGDLAANGMTILPWRAEIVEFSNPTFPSGVWLMARADSRMSPIQPTGSSKGDVSLVKPAMGFTLRETLGVVLGGGRQGATPPLAGAARETPPSLPTGDTSNLRGRVLVAEDSPPNRLVIERMLERLGLEAVLAEDGAEALEQWQRGGFDLVLMDCEMPGMDGFEATQAIRAREAGGRIPIVALTAHAFEDNRQRCEAAGMDDFLPKPFKADPLREVLGRWLGSAAAAGKINQA